MENTNVLNEEVVVTEEAVETTNKKGLGPLGVAAVVAGGVFLVKGVKAAHRKWIKPMIEKRKAKKLAAKGETQSSENEEE